MYSREAKQARLESLDLDGGSMPKGVRAKLVQLKLNSDNI